MGHGVEVSGLQACPQSSGCRKTSSRASNGAESSVPYTAVAWYAPELKRVVRFDASYASKYERVDEGLVLAEHRFD